MLTTTLRGYPYANMLKGAHSGKTSAVGVRCYEAKARSPVAEVPELGSLAFGWVAGSSIAFEIVTTMACRPMSEE